MQRFNFIYDLKHLHLTELHQLYAEHLSSQHILDHDELSEILLMHAADNFAIREQQSNAIVAFAWLKIVEDCAYIMDPVTHAEYRRYGTGQLLLRHILTHPALEFCSRIELSATADASQLLSHGTLPWQPKTNTAPPSRIVSIESLLLGSFA